MKLILKNFRCYLDQEFDFGGEGMVLLSGPSGSGKTTVLMAINFVLYGIGTKLITMGKTRCKVEMVFDNLKIVRTKKPNRLVVNNTQDSSEYEDEPAQTVLNERFGNAFDTISYVQQNALKSFIMMSPIDKLGFLETFALQGVNLSKIKGVCKNIIQNRERELTTTTSQLEMATNYLSELKRPEKVSWPLKKTADKELAMKNELTRCKNSKIKIDRTRKSLASLGEEYRERKILEVKIQSQQSSISKIENKIEEIERQKVSIVFEGEEKLVSYEKQLEALLKERELIILQEKYEQDKRRLEEMEESELENMKKQIMDIKNNLWKEYTENETNELIDSYKQYASDAEKIEHLKKSLVKYNIGKENIEEKKKDLEKSKKEAGIKKTRIEKLKLQQELYTCPSCDASLRFQNNELRLHDDELTDDDVDLVSLENELSTLNRQINKLEYIIPDLQSKSERYSELKKDIEAIESQYETEIPSKEEADTTVENLINYRRSQQDLERKIRKLEIDIDQKNFPSSFSTLQENLKTQKKRIKTLKSDSINPQNNPPIDEEDLRLTIEQQRRNKDKISDYLTRLKILNTESTSHKNELVESEEEYINRFQKIRNINDISKELKEKEEELKTLENDYEQHSRNVSEIDKYKRYKEEFAMYKEWIEKIETLKEDEKERRDSYAAATQLKDKILEAESIAIRNIIDSINAHAQEYLDIFFPTDPIVVRLLPFKEGKKNLAKPQINLQIDYKGMESDISMLSGGELARVILAYTLALAEIFNSPLILLDECTASIDQELTSTVIEGIRSNFGNKLTIVIAHQVVSGIFDRTIKL